jgi:hypothetical protein
LGLAVCAAIRYSRYSAPHPIKIASIAAVPAVMAISAHTPEALAAFAVAVPAGYIAWKRKNTATLTVFLSWGVMIYILSPFVTGHTVQLSFTGYESAGISFIISAVIYAAVALIAVSLSNQTVRLTTFIASIIMFIFLWRVSQVLLIRLFGFGGMESIRLSIFILMTGAAAGLISPLTKRTGSFLPGQDAAAGIILTILLGISGVWLAHTVMTRIEGASYILLERSALAVHPIQAIASRWDRDGDHYSPLFGFGDCDDSDPKQNPFMSDIPGDGIDQNCFNGDIKPHHHPYFGLPVDIVQPSLVPRLSPPSRPKTVIMLVIDTCSDAVDYNEKGNTPNLAKLARQGIVFPNGYAQSNHTTESVPNLLQAGFRVMPWTDDKLAAASLFRSAGLKTAAIFQDSADEWWGELGLGAKLFDFDKISRPDKTRWSRPLSDTIKEASDIAFAPGSDSRFVYVHLVSMHDTVFNVAGEAVKNRGGGVGGLYLLLSADRIADGYRKEYRLLANKVDAALEILISAMEQARRDRDVFLLITSDHGEELYEHGGFFHYGSLYEETLKVPVILYGDGVPQGRYEQPATLYCILPTALGWLNFGGRFVDTLGLIKNPSAEFPVFTIFAQYYSPWRRVLAIRDGDIKMIYNSAERRMEMYDLKTDPGEKKNIVFDGNYAAQKAEALRTMDITLSSISPMRQ